MDCTCDDEIDDGGDRIHWRDVCPTHVRCDEDCRALNDPPLNDLVEVTKAFLHWRGHSESFGCSHGS